MIKVKTVFKSGGDRSLDPQVEVVVESHHNYEGLVGISIDGGTTTWVWAQDLLTAI